MIFKYNDENLEEDGCGLFQGRGMWGNSGKSIFSDV